MPENDRLGKSVGFECFHRFDRAHGVEVFEDPGKFRWWDPMDCTPRGVKLYVVATWGCEVDLRPIDQLLIEPLCDEGNMQSMENATEADVNRIDPPVSVLVTREKYIGDSRQSVSGDVDNLRIEHISNEEEFVVSKVKGPHLKGHGLRAGITAQNDRLLIEPIDLLTVDQNRRGSRSDHQS